MDKSQLFSSIKEGLEKFTSRYGTLTEELNAVRKQFLTPEITEAINQIKASSATPQKIKPNEESSRNEALEEEQDSVCKLPTKTESSLSDISSKTLSEENSINEKSKADSQGFETSEYKSSDETDEDDNEDFSRKLSAEVISTTKDIQSGNENKAVKFDVSESSETTKQDIVVDNCEDEKVKTTLKVTEVVQEVEEEMSNEDMNYIDSSSYCSPESSDLEEENVLTELLKRVEGSGNTAVSVQSYDREEDNKKTSGKILKEGVESKSGVEEKEAEVIVNEETIIEEKELEESDEHEQYVDWYDMKSVKAVPEHSDSRINVKGQHQSKASKNFRKKISNTSITSKHRKENKDLHSVLSEYNKPIKVQSKKKSLAVTNKLKNDGQIKDNIFKVKVKKSVELDGNTLKIGKNLKNKPAKTFFKKQQQQLQTTKLQEKVNYSNKTIGKSIPLKNTQKKLSSGNVGSRNIIKVCQSINKVNKDSINSEISKIDLCVKESINKIKNVKSNTKTTAVKQIEPLIKTNPNNIFLKKDIKPSQQTPEENIMIGNNERGGGDVPEKLRIQEIIYSMNQSMNNLKSTNVPSHIVKVKDNTKQKDRNTIKSTDNYNSIHYFNNKNEGSIEQNREVKSSLPIGKQNTMGKLNKLFQEQLTSNIKYDKEKCNTAKVCTDKSMDNYDILQRGNTANPKEILARLEEQVSYDKNKDGEEKNRKVGQSVTKKVVPQEFGKRNAFTVNEQSKKKAGNHAMVGKTVKDKPAEQIKAKENVDIAANIERLSKPKHDRLPPAAKDTEQKKKEQAVISRQIVPHETISKIKNKMVALDIDESKLKLKLDSFPFILGQSTSRSYNLQANLQQTLSMMMMLPAENVRKTLSEDTKIPSNVSAHTTITRQSHEEKCPACVVRHDDEESQDMMVEQDPWDTEFTSKKFVRCTCMPRDTVNFKTVMRQLLVEASVGSIPPFSETSTLFEEPIDKNDDNKNEMIVYRRNDLNRLIRILHTTQGIRERLVT